MTLDELSEDEIQIIEARIKNTFTIKEEPVDEALEDGEIAKVAAEIVDQPAETLSWAEQVEAETASSEPPSETVPLAEQEVEVESTPMVTEKESETMPPPPPPPRKVNFRM